MGGGGDIERQGVALVGNLGGGGRGGGVVFLNSRWCAAWRRTG